MQYFHPKLLLIRVGFKHVLVSYYYIIFWQIIYGELVSNLESSFDTNMVVLLWSLWLCRNDMMFGHSYSSTHWLSLCHLERKKRLPLVVYSSAAGTSWTVYGGVYRIWHVTKDIFTPTWLLVYLRSWVLISLKNLHSSSKFWLPKGSSWERERTF
jgi:hypothetical protein